MITAAELHRRADMLAAQERGEGVVEWQHADGSYRPATGNDIGCDLLVLRLGRVHPKPCPFCGANGWTVLKDAEGTWWKMKHNAGCWAACMHQILADSEVLMSWNRRAQA